MTMTYENFQNLESEEKNQEMRKGDNKEGMESPKFALSMFTRVCAAMAHHAPMHSGALPDPITLHIQGPQRGRDRKTRVTWLPVLGGRVWEVCTAFWI